MVLNINGNDYEIHFGIGFVRKLDEKYFVTNQSGVKFGTGLETKVPMLLDNDAVTLAEFLYEGTCAEKKRPTLKEVDAYIDQVDDIDALYEEVIDELKKHNATKAKMAQMQKLMDAVNKK